MRSMTGFGSASRRGRDFDLEVEIRSVNHRFFSLKQSLPEGLTHREREIERMMRSRVARGSVTVSTNLKTAGRGGPGLPDPARFRAVHRRLREIRKALRLDGKVELRDILAVPAVWASEPAGTAVEPVLRKLVVQAADALVASRVREGRSIARDLGKRLSSIETLLRRLEARVPGVIENYRRRLDDRIRSLLARKGLENAQLDIIKEVALFADRADTSEEIQRLRAHVKEFRKVMRTPGQVGRRLDFLTQEMLREANTIGAKGSDAAVSAGAVGIKTELEKIKEQVENIE